MNLESYAEYKKSIWENPLHPWGENQHKKDLEIYKKNLEDLNNGRVSPALIIGVGYKNPKKSAIEYLKSSILEVEDSLSSGGASMPRGIENLLKGNYKILKEKEC